MRGKPIFSLFILLQAVTFAQTPIKKLERAYNNLLQDPQAKYAVVSLCILDAETGTTLFANNENIGVPTASTLKTITSATAFSVLGKDFRFQTTLAYTGSIINGTLKGNLIIVGGGDPTLGSPRYARNNENYILNQWVNAIRSAGIKKIDGSVIGDDIAWGSENTPEGWIWQDIGNYYGAAPSPLSWRENQFDINLKVINGKVELLKTVPSMPYLKFVNELTAGPEGSGDQAYAFLPPLANLGYLRGSWATGISKAGLSAALPDPAFDVAYRLQDTLRRLGINTSDQPTTTRQLLVDQKPLPAPTRPLITTSSPTLSEIIYWFNKKSINLYGENLIRTFAWKAGKKASTNNGVEAELDFWTAKGMDKNALNIVDGSGLSPGTRVTTSAMAHILLLAQKESWFTDYVRSFPENNGMLLKSGTINDVSAYAGYYTDSKGKKYVIVINISNYAGSGIRKKLFDVLDALK